jgi:hypothetical protein
MWETTCIELTELKMKLEQKRGALLSKNLIIKEALKILKEKEELI